MKWIAGSHHVLGIKHLASQFLDGGTLEGLGRATGEGSEPWYEEVKSRERDHVHSEFSQVRVELTRKTQTRGHSRHGLTDQLIQVPVCRAWQLQRTEADIVQGLIVNTECLVSAFNELMDRQRGIVRLDNSIRYLKMRHTIKLRLLALVFTV